MPILANTIIATLEDDADRYTDMLIESTVSDVLEHDGGGTNDVGYYRVDGVAGASDKVWGFAKMDKPAASKLAMVGVTIWETVAAM